MRKPMRILVTAGPTREFIDPVRFITNLSTGNMGYAIANVARKRNHKVTLISGPVNLNPPKYIRIIDVISAEDMSIQTRKHFKKADCLIMSAAVCDFRPNKAKAGKIKKANIGTLPLVQNPDILLWAGRNKAKRLIVGFCMETEHLIKRARQKLREKNADIIVANKIDKHNMPFGNNPTRVFILEKDGGIQKIGPEKKEEIAKALLDKIESVWYKKTAA